MVTQATIKFFPRMDSHVNGSKIPIYVRVILNREKFDFSSKMYISKLSEWDEVTQRVKTVKSPINSELSEIEHKVQEALNFLKFNNRPLTVYALRKQLRGEKTELPILINFVDDYIKKYVTENACFAIATKKTYYTTRAHLKKFLEKSKMNRIRVSEIDTEFIKQFDEYLQTRSINEKKGVCKNSAIKYHTKFKTIMFDALKRKLVDINPYSEFKFSAQPGKLTYLTSTELGKIEQHHLANNASLKRVRDIFLFSVYTGLRHSDATKLTIDNIEKCGKEHWIIFTQQKTGEVNSIPMLKRAVEIFEKYEEERKITGYILPRLSHQKLNVYLKTVADLAGIKKHLSHHVARHTAATTIFLQNGISLETTGKLLGHKSIRSTQLYAKVTNIMLKEAATKLNKLL